MSEDSFSGSVDGVFNSAVNVAVETQTKSIPSSFKTIKTDEYIEKQKFPYIQPDGTPYIKDDQNQPVEISLEEHGLTEDDCTPCSIMYGSETFVEDLERLYTAHQYESNSTADFKNNGKDFSGQDKTPTVAFNETSLTEDIDITYDNNLKPEVDYT